MKVKINDQIIDNITEISVDMGDVENYYDLCGLMGLCKNCIASNVDKPCGKRYLAYRIRSVGHLSVVTTDNDYIFDADTEYELL